MSQNGERSPLLGYNTNIRHKGKIYHVQTEDMGVKKGIIVTHLFHEGVIIATKKTDYTHLVNHPDREKIVSELMKEQHKKICLELKNGVYDSEEKEPRKPQTSSTAQGARIKLKSSPPTLYSEIVSDSNQQILHKSLDEIIMEFISKSLREETSM